MIRTLWASGLFILISFSSILNAQELDLDVMGPGLHRMVAMHPDGTEQRYIINIPENYDGSEAVPLILGLHYGFRRAEGSTIPEPYWAEGFFTKIYQQAFKPLNAIFLAADSVNGDWTTPENEDSVTRLMDSVITTYNIDNTKTIVTGYSMGAFGTWHWASKFQNRFAGAITIAGNPSTLGRNPEDQVMIDADWNIPLYVMHSRMDELVDIGPTKAYVEKLKADGKDVTFHELTVITHHQENLLPEPVGKTVPWIKRVWDNAN